MRFDADGVPVRGNSPRIGIRLASRGVGHHAFTRTRKKQKAVATDEFPPTLRAAHFLKTETGGQRILLSRQQRQELSRISLRLRLAPRMVVYREDTPANWVFVVSEGAVKCYRELPSGKTDLSAFIFPHDLFGLAKNGRYFNSARAITWSTVYSLSIDELTQLVRRDADLQFHFLTKVTHELRESQQRGILLKRRDAVGRLAMFLMMMHERMPEVEHDGHDIPLPMTRSDIAAFVGLSLESVSRAGAKLERQGIIKFKSRHVATIVDSGRLAMLAAAV